uniref:Citrate transporter-like domain-containing protein n=1 Tax=Heliothis virescens TaxID=7102 RepID=A0A2A4JSL5_HELVI
MDTRTTCQCYINDTVFMFFGSMVLANAVEQSGLHQRLALFAIRLIGYSHYRLLFAMSMTTMFISMWITNTAATTMMVPIIFALLDVFEKQNLLQVYEMDSNGELVASDITTCYFCAASFSATIGGIGTLVGTATNLVFKGLFERTYPLAPEYLSFPKFSSFSIPYMFVCEAGIYFYLIVMYLGFLRPKTKAAQVAQIPEAGVKAASDAVEETRRKIGKITFWEIMVMILFSAVILLFFSRAPQIFYGWGEYISDYYSLNNNKFVQDSAAALLVCFLMLLLPSNLDFFRNFYVKGNLFYKTIF